MTDGSTRRILIADDDPERLKAIVDRLQREGFHVLTAQDGLEALDRAREELPDAIVLNLLLRRIDGLRVCEILKSNPATTNIPVLLTAGVHVDADEGKRALAAGADRFLTDLGPLSTGSGRELGAGQDLVEAVRTLLGAEPELEQRPILLAIDDDPDNRAFLTKAVSKQGFEVVTAPNATQARRQLDGRRPALIFLDVQMPEESGLALLPQMLRDFPDAVVVMMTAYGSEQVAAEALRGGADDYIAKPIDLQRLREMLDRNLEKQRLRAERQSLVARLKDSNRYLMRQHAALRRADEEILQVNRQLEQSNRYKSEFLANMSHELRTPLNAILGFSEILLDVTMNLTGGERTEFLRNIHSSGQHLLGLINDILDLAKIEAGKMELKAEEMRVAEVLQEVTAILEPMARQQGLQLTTIGAVEASVIKADRSKFKQVLYNLLSNAVKFTPPPGQITITVKDTPDQLTVSVQDTGIGMKAEDLPKLFREFEQIDGSYTRRYQGTGLGLALCRRFVQMHGGRIWAESKFGKGSTFTFTIPREPRPALEAPAEEAAQTIESMELPLALVVEDDPASSQRMTAEIQGVGFRVAHAKDGDEAVRKAMEILPDLVVMETVLPVKDGWQVLQELRSRAATADVPVLVCSVTKNEPLMAQFGVVGYVAKPWVTKAMQDELRRVGQGIKRRRDRVRVLLVHRERKALAPLAAALVEEGFEVFRAPGLQEALEKARAAAPDVVVLGPPEPEWVLGLRGLPGQPALVALGEVSPRVPATAWSAVIPSGLSQPDAVLRAIKELDIVQRRRRTGRDRRQGLDRRR
ncbi:MAG: response regulator [Chloroflexi bacterium]|nr:MAG: response regulator [Chloroflexota bacterium]TMD66180.1 MAG: response regulator [Chloroflexota bacterium]